MNIRRAREWGALLAVSLASVGLVGFGTAQAVGAAQHAAAAPQVIQMAVFRGKIEGKPGIMGPDGKTHDTIVPANISVKVGVPVKLVITNYADYSHSITAAGLGINVVVQPGKTSGSTVTPVTTTFSFTPTKAGIYRWNCLIPCDKGAGLWAMGQGYGGSGKEGFMAGFIVVLAA